MRLKVPISRVVEGPSALTRADARMVALFGIFGNSIDVRFTRNSDRMADIPEGQKETSGLSDT